MARLRGGPSGNVVVISDSAAGATMARADALQRPGAEQPRLGGGEPAEQRGRREQDDAGDEDPAPAQDVAGPAAEQQQAAEGQRVGVDDPLQARAGEAQCVLDVGECDVDDGRVEHHHELRGGDDDEGQAEMALACASRCSWAPSPGRGLCGGHVISLREGRTELTRRRFAPGVEVWVWVETFSGRRFSGRPGLPQKSVLRR